MVERVNFPLRDIFVPSAPVRAQDLGLQKGEKVLALVQNVTENGASLQINGKDVRAATQVPLKAGQQILLEVADIDKSLVTLRVLETETGAASARATAGASQNETQRMAQNLLRLLSAEAGSSLFSKLSALLGEMKNIPLDFQASFSQFSAASSNAGQAEAQTFPQSLDGLIQHIALKEGTPGELTAQLKSYFQQFNDAQTRDTMLKTLLSLNLLSGTQNESSAVRGLNNALTGAHVQNGLAHLSHASPFFFLIPILIQDALLPLQIYYYKEKTRRGKSPREKTHLVILLTLPELGTLKIHVLAVLRALSIMISSSLPKIKAFLVENISALRESLEQLGFAVENLDVRVERNPANLSFPLAKEIQKQLLLKPVNVQA